MLQLSQLIVIVKAASHFEPQASQQCQNVYPTDVQQTVFIIVAFKPEDQHVNLTEDGNATPDHE